ncbi:CG14720 [Drosophila busckii]|uniref:CG14720 n=2 Tax=Drosophila busckii TaxID=30019 RepID=A0A0M4ESI9_DROBS|nr:CG14720 [Drosophila busckii]
MVSNGADHLKRLTRSLLLPSLDKETAPLLTFLAGFGIPLEDSPYEYVISGYVMRMQYFLPYSAEQLSEVYFKPQPITSRKSSAKRNLGCVYRWIFYRGIEMILEDMHLPGHSCLLRIICEHAALPLSHESGLLGELLSIVLTPSSSVDQLLKQQHSEYLVAERFGKRGGSCERAYGKLCQKSPMELISVLLAHD